MQASGASISKSLGKIHSYDGSNDSTTLFVLLHTLQNNFIDSKTTGNPIIFMYLRCGYCSWLLFICRCMASLKHLKWGLAMCCSWPQIHPTNHPSHFLRQQLLVDCCFAPIYVVVASRFCLSQLGVDANVQKPKLISWLLCAASYLLLMNSSQHVKSSFCRVSDDINTLPPLPYCWRCLREGCFGLGASVSISIDLQTRYQRWYECSFYQKYW